MLADDALLRMLQGRTSRRGLLAGSATAFLGFTAAPWINGLRTGAARSAPESRWPWPYDVDGDGRLGDGDRAAIGAALGRRRGSDLAAAPGWTPAADFLAVGSIESDHLAAWDRVAAAVREPLPPRPVLVCFHYGWYRGRARRGGTPTVRYRGGSYASASRGTEEEFHRLKSEFGIDADLLSWIDRPTIRHAYERGYLAAENLHLRRFGLLYETVINLGSGVRMPFASPADTGARLVDGFRRMADWAAHAVRERGARPLTVDGRPVVYIFASHLFGSTRDDLPAVGQALAGARSAFADVYGAPPYLIGDESPFPDDPGVAFDRAYRALWFDAVTRYHHYDERQARRLASAQGGALRLDAGHRARLVANEARAVAGFRGVHNEHTGAPVLVVPSSAAGFAKTGMPPLRASESDYRELLAAMLQLTDEHLARDHGDRLGTPALPAPLVMVGSWNEEFEGHALMPAAANHALVDSGRHGFEWLYAIKGLYGTTHRPPRTDR